MTLIKGTIEGVGILVIILLAKKLDKNLFSPIAVKSGIVLVTAAALSNLGVDYLEEKGYLK